MATKKKQTRLIDRVFNATAGSAPGHAASVVDATLGNLFRAADTIGEAGVGAYRDIRDHGSVRGGTRARNRPLDEAPVADEEWLSEVVSRQRKKKELESSGELTHEMRERGAREARELVENTGDEDLDYFVGRKLETKRRQETEGGKDRGDAPAFWDKAFALDGTPESRKEENLEADTRLAASRTALEESNKINDPIIARYSEKLAKEKEASEGLAAKREEAQQIGERKAADRSAWVDKVVRSRGTGDVSQTDFRSAEGDELAARRDALFEAYQSGDSSDKEGVLASLEGNDADRAALSARWREANRTEPSGGGGGGDEGGQAVAQTNDRDDAWRRSFEEEGSALGQRRSLESDAGRMRRSARRLKRKGYGKAAEQMAMAGEMERINTPGVKSEAYREAEEKNKLDAAEEEENRRRREEEYLQQLQDLLDSNRKRGREAR